MAAGGPDSGYSWVIVLCCAYIHFALFGLFRSAGVIYVAVLQSYDVTREEASWPFALCAAVFQLIGPAASILTHYISQRQACLLGSAIATFGIAGCYFADSVMWINIFYGVVHGLGFGLVVTLVPVTLNQYFVKHRATAIGIAFSGGTLSSLIFPSAMEWLLENYTLRDSFLLLSGFVMNTLVASSLLRAPSWMKESSNSDGNFIENGSEAKDSGVSTSADTEAKILTVYGTPVNKCATVSMESSIYKDSSEMDKTLYQISEITNESQRELSDSRFSYMDTVCSNDDSALYDGENSRCDDSESTSMKTESLSKIDSEAQKPLMQKGNKIHITPKKGRTEEEHRTSPHQSNVVHSLRDILRQPVFYLITSSTCIYFLGVHSFFMVIVDFAKDKGIPEYKGIYIISMFSLTDLFGRAGLGWVTDRNFISRRAMIALNLGALGFLYQLYPLIDSLSGVLVIAAFCGLAVGSSITLFFVLQAECFGMKNLTLVIGLTSFINGMMSLLRPGIIGMFRDFIGSYNWMFHFLGFNFLIFSVIWFVASWRTKDGKSLNQIHKA